MRILLVGPLPPPMTGNALPVKVLAEGLSAEMTVDKINLSKKEHKAGVTSLSRVLVVIRRLWAVFSSHRKADVFYLTIAESLGGNLRDIVIYWLCRRRLGSVIVHLFGGAGMQKILSDPSSLQYKINIHFLNRVGAIVVEGTPQKEMFAKAVSHDRIYAVPNFAEDFLFSTEELIKEKFSEDGPLRILFLSNLLPGKGHIELAEAFMMLPREIQSKYQLTFAGKPVTPDDEAEFRKKLGDAKNVRYIGPVYGEEKRAIFSQSHIFCLPTYYAYEGQPFSIIEAYASGCAVITTYHSGIKFIFQDSINGFRVDTKSSSALSSLLKDIQSRKDGLCEIAMHNLREAKSSYRSERYLQRMKSIIFQIVQNDKTMLNRI